MLRWCEAIIGSDCGQRVPKALVVRRVGWSWTGARRGKYMLGLKTSFNGPVDDFRFRGFIAKYFEWFDDTAIVQCGCRRI